MTGFSFDALRRDIDVPGLAATDATDRLLLDEAAGHLAAAPPGTVAVVGDRFGALTLGAVALHGVVGVRTHQDLLTGERALAANAARCGLDGTYRALPLAEAVAGAHVVLLQLPTSLDELDEIAEAVAAYADPDVVVLAGGRVKHMTPAQNEVLARWFGHVEAHLARQKSRVVLARGPRPEAERPRRERPARTRHDDVGLTVCAHGGVFAGTGIDIGSRFLLAHRDQLPGGARAVLDLACGSGVLGVAVALARPDVHVTMTDVSASAVASARATAAANGVADRVDVRQDDGAASLAPASVDVVLLNPPFHQGATVHAGIAYRLVAEAARVLRPGGELWAVWNSHLRYRPALERTVGPTRQAGRNPKFTVTASIRRRPGSARSPEPAGPPS